MGLKVKAGMVSKGNAKLTKTHKLIDQISKQLKGGTQLAVGLPSNSLPYPDGTSVIQVAFSNEFGASIDHPGGTRFVVADGKARFVSNSFVGPVTGVTKAHKITIPERPFLREGFRQNKDAWLKLAKKLYAKAVREGKEPKAVLRLLGEQMQIDIQKSLDSGSWEPNAPAYAAFKAKSGKTKPLIVTGHLRNSIRWVLR